MIAAALHGWAWVEQYLDPGQAGPGGGYWFWSGIGSDLGEFSIVAAVALWLRHHNCHRKGCWRLGHLDPAHGHPVCRPHSSHFGGG